MRKQEKLTFIIGYEYDADLLEKFIQLKQNVLIDISKICGGCTVFNGAGYWVEDGAEKGKVFFAGDLQTERALIIDVTCEPEKVEKAYTLITASIAEHTKGLPIEWVHCTQTQIIGRHFNVKEIQANG